MRTAALVALCLLCVHRPLCAEELSYWIEPCRDARTACQPGDPQLAQWALAAWERAADGRLHLTPSRDEATARLRVRWVPGGGGLYGEMRPISVNGQPGAELFICPDQRSLGPEIDTAATNDPLLRDTIVFLTCLHESGHALGLRHTRDYADIMYSFGYGGDVPGYFARHRRRLATRADLARTSALSPGDLAQLGRRIGD